MARSRLSLIVSCGAVSLPGAHEQLAGLVVAERRRLAFAALGPGPLDAFDRVVGDGVFLAEILEQRGQRREAVPHRAAARASARQIVAPGDDVGAGHGAEFLRPIDAGEAHEIADRLFVGAAGVAVGEVGEPFDLGRNIGEPVKFRGGEEPFGGGDLGRERDVGHGANFILDKICYRRIDILIKSAV